MNLGQGTYAVRDDMGVTVERALRVAVLRLVAGQVPDDQALVTAAGEEHVGAREIVSKLVFASSDSVEVVLLHRGGQAGDPAIL